MTNNINAPLMVPSEWHFNYHYSYGRVSRFFREVIENKRLYANRCNSCAFTWSPPRGGCPKCHGDLEWVALNGEGTIVSYTIVYVATSEFDHEAPYAVGYIKLDGCNTSMYQRIISDDLTKLKVGMRVKAVFKNNRQGTVNDFHFELAE